MKICSKCEEEKDINQFYNQKQGAGGKTSECKTCRQKAGILYAKRNRKRIRDSQRSRWHGLPKETRQAKNRKNRLQGHGWSIEAYDAQLSKQNGLCATPSCGRPATQADHDHKLKLPRFLLCQGCNHVLGHAYESVAVLADLTRMLRKWQKNH